MLPSRLKKGGKSVNDLSELPRNARSNKLLEQLTGTMEFGDFDSLIREIRVKRSEWRE